MTSVAKLADQARISKFCAEKLSRATNVEAYLAIYRRGAKRGYPAEKLARMAERYAARPEVRATMQRMVDSSRARDLISGGAAFRQTLLDAQACREAGNYSALAQFNKIVLQVTGELNESTSVNFHFGGSDTKLIEHLARGDPQRAEWVRKLLVPASFAPAEHQKESA